MIIVYLFFLLVFNDGTSKQLLCLGGTIPVHYKGMLFDSFIKVYFKYISATFRK